jgi:hypothetical protein
VGKDKVEGLGPSILEHLKKKNQRFVNPRCFLFCQEENLECKAPSCLKRGRKKILRLETPNAFESLGKIFKSLNKKFSTP